MPGEGQPWLHELITVLSAPTMALSEQSGQMRRSGAQGVLHAHSRVLSQAVLEIDGAEPFPARSGLLSASTALFASIPRRTADDSVDPAVWVERQRTVSAGLLAELVRVTGGPRARGDVRVTLRVAADLAVLPDIKSGLTCPLATITAANSGLEWGAGALRVTLSAPGAVLTVAGDGGEAQLTWLVRLPGGSGRELGWQLVVRDSTAVVTAAPALRAGQDRPWARVRAESADSRLPRLLGRSIEDLAALRMTTARVPGEVFLGAGTPWFLTLFGRDSIWAARLLLPFGWQLASGTLATLAAFQGRRIDRRTGEAPGKIPHELQPTSRATAHGEGLPALYYGTIDATALWVCLLHDAWRWGMPDAVVRALLPCMKGALEWMREHGDADGDGLLEYRDETGTGLANQGWKDSRDAIRFSDGRIASPPVTLCEVQGYAHEAATAGASLLDAFGEPGAAQWRAWAGRLADAFRSSFWVRDPDGDYPALALDGQKRKVDALTSNIGHLLGTGLLSREEESLVADRLGRPDLNSGFGLRTMSADCRGYSPLSYHCGSVWSHDTAIAIGGLIRSGQFAAAVSLADGLLDAAETFEWRLPELFSGRARTETAWPTPYPPSCRPQAWAAAAAGAIILAYLGLEVDVPALSARLAPPRAGGPDCGLRPAPLRVDGLVAGHETFSAGIDADGSGYVSGLSLALASR
ncbi:MAG TPA: glycogen debranching N-terminal domain-containing protein [Streptosporangiaceae bacterium]|nr:glycogen debranching N-terminal domain-containing protein [Streptosporangiaceae bacterium]